MARAPAGRTRDIIVEGVVAHAPGVVWTVLTTAGLIGRWLMPNDFEPVVGHSFTFQSQPMGDWDGVVQCEVLEAAAPSRLVYSWKGGSDSNPAYGASLDSMVIWTLTPDDGGTRVRLVHAGFRSPGNDFAYQVMSPGWGRVLKAIDRIAAELA